MAKAKDDTTKAKDETKDTKGLKSRVAHKVTKLAPPGLVAQMMGSMVCRKLPKRMLKKGITVEVKEIFREATYVVLQMRVVHVDSVLFAKKRSKKRRKKGKKSTNSNNWINSFWNMVGEDYQKRFEEDYCKFQQSPAVLLSFRMCAKIAHCVFLQHCSTKARQEPACRRITSNVRKGAGIKESKRRGEVVE